MKKIVRLISAVICFFQLNVQAEEPKEYTFAINSAVTPLLHAAFINETIKTVERSVAPAKLKVLYVELPELERLIENHQTDFFISTAATIRRYQDLGARDVLTASSPFSKNPNRSEGSLFIVKAGRSDINSISDLKDKRAAAGRPTAFGMYLAAMGEIAADGYDPKTFFKSTQFYGLNRDQIIKDVLDGKADVGILRACYLEDAVNRKVVTTDQLKFINLKNDPEHICLHSMRLYPNWSFGSNPSVPPAVLSAVAAGLIAQKPVGIDLYWSVASDFTAIDNLLKSLQLGSYQRFSKEWFWQRIIEYRFWVLGTLAAFALLLIHSFIVSRTVNIKTQELKESLKRESQSFHEAQEAHRRLMKMQRAAVVGQISSLIAHELNQPLAGIKLYARTLQRAKDSGTLTEDKLGTALAEIRTDADLAAAIVERVRSYAKGARSERVSSEVSELVNKAVREFKRQSGERVEVKLTQAQPVHVIVNPLEFELVIITQAQPVHVIVNPLEFELVIINLLRNAAQALQELGVSNPKVDLTIRRSDNSAMITIEDNGHIEKETIAKLSEPTNSTKADGLGLGLQIVRSIIENHGGKISFSQATSGGLRVEIRLPVQEETK